MERIVPLEDIQATGVQLVHENTRARHIHLSSTDDNNLFSVTFRTPPTDSTGVAHILEHTVLCGSQRFPVRDPFFSMIRRSLSTFMNALTSDDWTMYPFSTRNRKDYFNLLSVYLDACFFPTLAERDFQQEGHRLEYEADEHGRPRLVFKGVVYNEMRGALSDPRSRLGHRLAKALFPTTTYGHNSGGDPWEIPDLSWEGLREFHRRYYHPSNARFLTFGNLPLEDQLHLIEDAVLKRFEALEPESFVSREPAFNAPLRVEDFYPAAPGEGMSNKSMVQVAWRGCSLLDDYEVLSMRVLSALLLGNPAAPLYKALLDSRLGSQLAAGTGYETQNLDTVFAAGLQGVARERTAEVEELVLSTLRDVSMRGFPQERVEAVIHQLEFGNREIIGDHFPYPLILLFRMIGSWNHDGDPFHPLLVSRFFERLRSDSDKGGFFQDLLRQKLLENPHRVTLALHPDPDMQERDEDRVRNRLLQIESGFGPEDRETIRRQAEDLQAEQEKEQDLSCLPTLLVEDIRREELVFGTETDEVQGVPVQWCPQSTNRITYAALQFDLSGLPAELASWAGFFAQALTQVGAAGQSYTTMAERIEACTGGISATAEVLENGRDLGQVARVLEVRAKALDRNVLPMCDLLRDIILSPDFSDLHRIQTLVGQAAASLENSVPHAGHRYAAGRAARYLTRGGYHRDTWRGLDNIRRMKAAAAGTDEDRKLLAVRLQDFAACLAASSRVRLAVTASESGLRECRGGIEDLIGEILAAGRGNPLPSPGPGDTEFQPQEMREGWATSVAVSYVTRVYRTVPFSHPDTGALLVLAKVLKFGYLHREIREKGGAYGGMAVASPTTGLFSLMSYRDPNFERTFDAFEGALDWVCRGAFSDENIREAVLGVFSDLDGVLSPEGRGLHEWYYAVQGITPEDRQFLRDRILSITRDRLVEVANRLLARTGTVRADAAISSQSTLDRIRNQSRFQSMKMESI